MNYYLKEGVKQMNDKCRTDSTAYHDPDDVMTDAEEREQEQKQSEARIENYEKFGSFMNHNKKTDQFVIAREILENDDNLSCFFVALIANNAGGKRDAAASPLAWDYIDKACRTFANNMLDSGQELPWRNE